MTNRVTKKDKLIEALKESPPKTIQELSGIVNMTLNQVHVTITALRNSGIQVVTRKGKSDGIVRTLNRYSIDSMDDN